MTNTPLDAPTEFSPSSEDRPAGEWMERYWAESALWAKRFAYTTWAYYSWIVLVQLRNIYSTLGSSNPGEFVKHLLTIAGYAAIPGIGYFAYRFAHDLQRSLAERDQLLLEKAFRELHRLIIVGLITAAVWVLPTITQWSIAYQWAQTMYRYSNPTDEAPIPLESESNSTE